MFDITLGEKRIVSVGIGLNAPDFTIQNYTYKLTYNGETVDAGTPIMDNHILYTYVEPQHTGVYVLTFEFDLGNGEHIIRSTTIRVSSLRVE